MPVLALRWKVEALASTLTSTESTGLEPGVLFHSAAKEFFSTFFRPGVRSIRPSRRSTKPPVILSEQSESKDPDEFNPTQDAQHLFNRSRPGAPSQSQPHRDEWESTLSALCLSFRSEAKESAFGFALGISVAIFGAHQSPYRYLIASRSAVAICLRPRAAYRRR